MGVLPAECDPDGEGIFDSACTAPLDYDPFAKASCDGADLAPDLAKRMFGGAVPFKPNNADVYYNTRQCVAKPGAAPDCSPWVYAFAMDVKFATIKPTPNEDGNYTMATDATRKATVDFSAVPAALKQVCLDGPFMQGPLSTPTAAAWTPLPDGSPGLCTTAFEGLASKLTVTCGRFELPAITLSSGDPSHYTELQPVLYARL
jgi:hypothetical protein